MVRIGVLTGIDGTGKSNLIDLVRELDPKVEVRRLRPAVNPFLLAPGESLQILHDEIYSWPDEPEDKIILYDRCVYPDEFVYGNLMSMEDLQFYDHLFELSRVKFVYCLPANDREYRAAKAKEPDEFFATHTPIIYWSLMDKYDYFLAHTKCPVLKMLHFEDPDFWFKSEDAELVLSFVKGEKS